MSPGYRLLDGPPTVEDYLRLRHGSGLTPKTAEQAAPALSGSWAACHTIDEATGETVAMGRVLGDGGWYFHIADMAVLPAHQRRGLGDAVLTWLVEQIEARAPEGAFITLLADAPGRRLYGHHGFVETAPKSIGMVLRRAR